MLCTPRILRLCRRIILTQNKRYYSVRATNNGLKTTANNIDNNNFEDLYERHKEKISFNSHLEQNKLQLGYYKYFIKTIQEAKKTQAKQFKEKSLPAIPVSLRYLVEDSRLLKEESESTVEEPEKIFQLPLASSTKVDQLGNDDKIEETFLQNSVLDTKGKFDCSDIENWMSNYEHYDDLRPLGNSVENDSYELDVEWSKQYGTPDPKSRISRVPCGGCGALLHCSDTAIPGYLPSEIYKNTTDEDRKGLECQRCHFLKEYNIALDVSVPPEEFQRLLESIRNVKSLVVLMVDLLDYPCSIWPGIVDIIGTKRPIIIVGNKVDILPGDSIGYLKRVRKSLLTEINKTKLREANIKHVALISAKTGFGVENLISAMFKIWLAKGHVFLVGCTNVGKSSLFNALLQSDYCKVQAVDIVKRATVSRWPGTTLNLLKFPINRPSGWKIHERTQRLKADSRLMKTEKVIRKAHIEGTSTPEMPTLMGYIGRTFSNLHDFNIVGSIAEKRNKILGLDEKSEVFAKSKWLYDTPGIMHEGQALSLLTTEELLLTVPRELIRPQTYYLRPGSSLLVAGLARVDFHCEEECRFTVFCSKELPITVTPTEHADEVYNEFLGTELLGVPQGGAERLKNWPGLAKRDEPLEFIGEGPDTCCGDIVLSNIAWVGVTAKQGSVCRVWAWTPEARGIHRRHPAVLPSAVKLKGKRLRDTPAYMLGKVFVDDDYMARNKSSILVSER